MIREVHLPVWAIVPEVNRLLATESALVVTAPPGAGKSTVLPLTMLEAFPEGKILMWTMAGLDNVEDYLE